MCRFTCRSPCGERGLKFYHVPVVLPLGERRSPCGERGLKSLCVTNHAEDVRRRSPCGERGLKSLLFVRASPPTQSLPVRGAWIEIFPALSQAKKSSGRSPCGERGLKWKGLGHLDQALRRSPCGERGLKWQRQRIQIIGVRSLPVRGAWIEIRTRPPALNRRTVAPRAGSVD